MLTALLIQPLIKNSIENVFFNVMLIITVMLLSYSPGVSTYLPNESYLTPPDFHLRRVLINQ